MPEFETEEGNLFHVGYALPARKIEAFMVPSFIAQAKQRGINFIPIDISKPLTHQGPFDCIIHKTYGDEWTTNLDNFSTSNPNATIIDPISAIQRLHNRISMLEPVSQLNIPKLSIPTQILIKDSESLTSSTTTSGIYFPNQQASLADGTTSVVVESTTSVVVESTTTSRININFPFIAKPLLADGTTKAHDMSLVLNHTGLMKSVELDPPFVLQQFVNHGGTIFKVYVADDYVECVIRSSLPDLSKEMIEKMSVESGGAIGFSRISGAVSVDDNSGEKVKMPEREFLEEVAKGLREALGLHLFNFDMIKDGEGDGYLVIDINYFPGYEKLPDYESVMIDFFLNIKKSQELGKMTKEKITKVGEQEV